MSDLLKHFLQSISGWSGRLLADIDGLALESQLAQAAALGRAAWPTLDLPGTTFASHLGRGVPEQTDPVAALAGLHFDDLYLATACLESVTGAAELLEREYRPVIARYLKRIDASPEAKAEVSQSLLADLLAPGADGARRLGQFEGRGTLAQWIGISAQRVLLNTRRSEDVQERLVARLAEEPAPAMLGAEDSLLRRRYKTLLEKALLAAVEALDRRERTIMRFHLVHGITKARIAKMYRVDQRTVGRQLERAHRAVWTDVGERLHGELGLSLPEVESILRDVGPYLDISLSSALASTDPGISSDRSRLT